MPGYWIAQVLFSTPIQPAESTGMRVNAEQNKKKHGTKIWMQQMPLFVFVFLLLVRRWNQVKNSHKNWAIVPFVVLTTAFALYQHQLNYNIKIPFQCIFGWQRRKRSEHFDEIFIGKIGILSICFMNRPTDNSPFTMQTMWHRLSTMQSIRTDALLASRTETGSMSYCYDDTHSLCFSVCLSLSVYARMCALWNWRKLKLIVIM